MISFNEATLEKAFIELFKKEDYEYQKGNSIKRDLYEEEDIVDE